jgi:hypothetical protein
VFARRLLVFAVALASVSAPAQLRIATWNITDYGGDAARDPDIKNVVYGVFSGRSMAPDAILVQEFLSATATTRFLMLLNTATGSPGDWAAAPFVNGPDTDGEFFYRTSKVQYLGMTIVSTGGLSPEPPRNTYRYDIRPVGYSAAGTTIACYNVHLKSSNAADDMARRLVETQRVRTNAEGLPSGWNFLIGGDFNIRTSSEAAYNELVVSKVNNAGRFFDPIKSPGTWNNNSAFRFLHTQDPAVTGMDDRFDQLLLSAGLVDGQGLDYLGNPSVAYSTTTWNDPNHSYRAWGNDGTSFGVPLTVTGNTMVGAVIAQSIINCANVSSTGGHIPVYLDMRVPGKVSATGPVNFGSVPVGMSADMALTVSNIGNTALWTTNGIANLNYSLAASGDVSAPSGSFSAAAGASGNNHMVLLDTATPGMKSGSVTVNSNDPDSPATTLNYTGEVYVEVLPNSYTLFRGSTLSGGMSDLYSSDDSRWVLRPGAVFTNSEYPVQLILNGNSPSNAATILRFILESHSGAPNINQKLFLYNYNSLQFEEMDSRTMSTADSTITVTVSSNASRFIDPITGAMQAKIACRANGAVFTYPWQARLDKAVWTVTP